MVMAMIGAVGVLAGVIVGALLTQMLQRRNTALARLHEARIDAYRDFAAAMMEYRKSLMDRWFIDNEGRPKPDGYDVYATRSAAWAAYYQVVLLAGDRNIVRLAEEARDRTSSLKQVETRAELDSRGDACRTAVGQFAELARREVSPRVTG